MISFAERAMNSGFCKKWFDYYLKGIGDGKFEEAYIFQTGSHGDGKHTQAGHPGRLRFKHCMRARTGLRHLQNH
jgi:hypothetical protein